MGKPSRIAALPAASLIAAAMATSAAAQERPRPSPPEGAQLEEITVTARRIEENIQSVPIAIIAINEEKLQDTNIKSGWDLTKAMPGLRFGNYPTNLLANGLIISRAVPGVQTYLDDVPFNPNSTAGFFDVSNVQFLKGPQGTLFGVAVTSGALLFETRKPTDTFEGYVVGGIGGREHRELQGVVNMPLAGDKLLLRAGAQYYSRRGYVYDLSQDEWLSDRNFWQARLSATFRPNDRFENTTRINYFKSDTNGDAFAAIYYNPNRSFVPVPDPSFPQINWGFSPVAAAYGGLALAPPPYANSSLADRFFTEAARLGPYVTQGANLPGWRTYLYRRQTDVVNTTTWELSDSFTLKNIIGWERSITSSLNAGPIGGTPFPSGSAPVPVRLPNGTLLPVARPAPFIQFSEEFQLQGRLFDDKLTFVVGTFNIWGYNKGPFTIDFSSGLPLPTNPGSPTLSAQANSAKRPTSTHAVYGQATVDLGDLLDGLKFTAGYRRNWDRRKVENIFYDVNSALAGRPVVILQTVRSGLFKTPAYTLSLSYQMNPDTMFFITNSKSYGIGNFNANPGLPANLVNIKPESVNNIEAGVKSQFRAGDMSARLNLSGFSADYRNAQTIAGVSFVNTVTGATVLQAVRINVQKVHLWGGELDAVFIPTPSLELRAAAAYLRYSIDEYITPDGRNLTGVVRYLPASPKLKYSLSAAYHVRGLDPSWGSFTLGADWSHTSMMTSSQSDPIVPYDSQRPFGNLDMSLKWRDVLGREGLDLTLLVTNVTKTVKSNGAQPTYTGLGVGGFVPAEPRTWTLTARYGF